MSITAKEKDNNKPKEKFPTNDRDYYYYYEVSQLIQLKNYYNSINSLILADKLENSVLNKYKSKNNEFSKEEIYTEYKKYYDDFNFYIDALINKTDINSNEDFKNIMEYLMLTVCQTNHFINRYLLLKSNKEFYFLKMKFNGKNVTVKKILSENEYVMYKLNPHYLPIVISNASLPTILFTLFLVLLIIAVATKYIFWVILFLVYGIWYYKMLPTIHYAEKQNSIYFFKNKYIAHPLSQRIKLKDIITTLSFIKDITQIK